MCNLVRPMCNAFDSIESGLSVLYCRCVVLALHWPVLPPALQVVGGRKLTDFTTEFTVEVWLRVDQEKTTQTSQQEPMAVLCKLWSVCLRIIARDGSLHAQSMYYPDASGVIGHTVIEPGPWYHVAAILGQNEHSLYVDGERDGARPVLDAPSVHQSSSVLSVGSSGPPLHSQQFDGSLGGVRIWSKALGEAELHRYMPYAIDGTVNHFLWASHSFEPLAGTARSFRDSSGKGHHPEVPSGCLAPATGGLGAWERPAVRTGA